LGYGLKWRKTLQSNTKNMINSTIKDKLVSGKNLELNYSITGTKFYYIIVGNLCVRVNRRMYSELHIGDSVEYHYIQGPSQIALRLNVHNGKSYTFWNLPK
jgi:hypothetical protein